MYCLFDLSLLFLSFGIYDDDTEYFYASNTELGHSTVRHRHRHSKKPGLKFSLVKTSHVCFPGTIELVRNIHIRSRRHMAKRLSLKYFSDRKLRSIILELILLKNESGQSVGS
jgi:hypothetical protein